MGSVFSFSADDRMPNSRSTQHEDYELGICCINEVGKWFLPDEQFFNCMNKSYVCCDDYDDDFLN
jgi:hypothetical protein